ncbi:MAG: sulfatase, partial [Planctomycetales bacterium]|nr:sulfatase [Planctomycetales bacterium]
MKVPFALALACLLVVCGAQAVAADKPNVLMIVIDDLNDWVGCLHGHPDVKTPNIDRLARKGVLFASAHCQAPICTPSRNSVFSGRLPSTTGCYDLPQLYRTSASLANVESMPEFFGRHGYFTLGGGKVFHGEGQDRFDESLGASGGPRPAKRMHWKTAVWDWGPFPESDDEMADMQLARRAAAQLQKRHERPFFMAVGFSRPHVPLHVPPKWFALYDPQKITVPSAPDDDLDDLPQAALDLPTNVAPLHKEMLEGDRWRSIVQAYLASTSFVDACVGEVVQGLEAGPHRDNTVVVLWSDHGFHLGEKHRWAKRTLWEESTRVPLVIAGPGVAKNQTCQRAVGLVDLYPTLAAKCDLPKPAGLDGVDLGPLLEDAQSPWDRPAITTFLRGNHAVRSENWRYIRYADGSEELYDHRRDADERTNLAGDPAFKQVIAEHAQWL